MRSYLKYGGNTVQLNANLYNPSYPDNEGLKLHSYSTEMPYYSVTNRMHGTTEKTLGIESLTKTKRSTLESFWKTTLTNGKYGFTYIDPWGKVLFESSWNDWIEEFTNRNGGLYNIAINLKSPCVATVSSFGLYLKAFLTNHNLNDNDISLSSGVLVDKTDTEITRQNGYALKLAGDFLGEAAYGVNSTVSFKTQYTYNSLSLFTQVKFIATPVLNSFVTPIELYETATSSVFKLYCVGGGAAVGMYGSVINGSANNITKAAGTYAQLTLDTWYDVAITYNAVNSKIRVYYMPSAVTSFTNFLTGSDTQEDFILSTNSTPGVYPPDVTWNRLRLIYAQDISDNIVYLQNAMVFDGYLTPFDFNTLRRLCYLWNGKTEDSPA